MPVEIFVPFYGDPSLLYGAVASVLAQDHPDWTLTVVDDGYPDESVGTFFAALTDHRVRYLRNEVNLGANGNYRRCVSLAGAELLVILGADDELMPNYVRTVLAAHLEFPGAAVIQPGVVVIDEAGRPRTNLLDSVKRRLRPVVVGRREFGGQRLATSLLRGNWLYFPSLAFARVPMTEVGFREGLNVVQDLALVIDLVAGGHHLVVDATTCFRYRRHSASDSSWRALDGSRFVEETTYFQQAAAQMAALGWTRAARAARRHWLSRANALTQLPKAIRAGQRAGAATLARQVVGFRRRGSDARAAADD